ncbi:hypothetical protein Rs2_10246 [Raphanus sativus]|nr:hypothetical protein Rs2_10246 [Raphanus sativus]
MGSENFWTLDAQNQRSWIWKSICSLRASARQFLICEVVSGITASFWQDSWTPLGPLIEITGPEGPQVSGLSIDASVSDAIVEGEWWLSRLRTRNPLIQLLKQCLPEVEPIVVSESDDTFAWKVGDQTPVLKFPTAATWNFLHPPGHSTYTLLKLSMHSSVGSTDPPPTATSSSSLDSFIKLQSTLFGRSATPEFTLPSPVLLKQPSPTLKT